MPSKTRRPLAPAADPASLAAAAVRDDGAVRLDAQGQLPQDLRIEWVSVKAITPYANNPRNNENAVADVKASLLEFGWEQPLVVDRDGVIIVGHTRFYAALDLAQLMVPVYYARHLSPAKVKAYRLADNKIGERAEWDYGKLKIEFQQLEDLGGNMGSTGFRDFEMAPIRASEWEAPAASGALGGERGDPGDGEEEGVVRFEPVAWETVLRAVEKKRRDTKDPHLTIAEALTRIAQAYAPGKGRVLA